MHYREVFSLSEREVQDEPWEAIQEALLVWELGRESDNLRTDRGA